MHTSHRDESRPYWSISAAWKGLCITNQSYSRDNRLIFAKSPYRREGLAPRCWLILSWSWRRFQGLGCSPMKGVPELSLERRETVWILPGVRTRKNWGDGTVVREDPMLHATGVTVVLLKAWLCSYAWIGESLKAYQARNFPQDTFFQTVEKVRVKDHHVDWCKCNMFARTHPKDSKEKTLDWNKPWSMHFFRPPWKKCMCERNEVSLEMDLALFWDGIFIQTDTLLGPRTRRK